MIDKISNKCVCSVSFVFAARSNWSLSVLDCKKKSLHTQTQHLQHTIQCMLGLSLSSSPLLHSFSFTHSIPSLDAMKNEFFCQPCLFAHKTRGRMSVSHKAGEEQLFHLKQGKRNCFYAFPFLVEKQVLYENTLFCMGKQMFFYESTFSVWENNFL